MKPIGRPIWQHFWFYYEKNVLMKWARTVEPRYKKIYITKGQGTSKMGSMKRGSLYRGIEVIFHIFYHYWGKENRSLHRGLRYKKVRYIEVLLHVMENYHHLNLLYQPIKLIKLKLFLFRVPKEAIGLKLLKNLDGATFWIRNCGEWKLARFFTF